MIASTVYLKKYAHGFCFAVLCCGYTLTDFPISIRLTSLALWQSNDCPSASKAALMNMDKYFMWIHYERLHNHNKAKHNKTVCIFLGLYCICLVMFPSCFTGMYINWFNGSGSGWFFAGIASVLLMDGYTCKRLCVDAYTPKGTATGYSLHSFKMLQLFYFRIHVHHNRFYPSLPYIPSWLILGN